MVQAPGDGVPPDRGIWSRDSRTELGASENGGVTRGIGKLGPRYTINPRGTPDTPEPTAKRTGNKRKGGGWEQNQKAPLSVEQ